MERENIYTKHDTVTLLICFTSWYEHENTEQIHTNLMYCNKWKRVCVNCYYSGVLRLSNGQLSIIKCPFIMYISRLDHKINDNIW